MYAYTVSSHSEADRRLPSCWEECPEDRFRTEIANVTYFQASRDTRVCSQGVNVRMPLAEAELKRWINSLEIWKRPESDPGWQIVTEECDPLADRNGWVRVSNAMHFFASFTRSTMCRRDLAFPQRLQVPSQTRVTLCLHILKPVSRGRSNDGWWLLLHECLCS